MKRIKIFDDSNKAVLEMYVNDFLETHPVSVTDIQFRMSDDGKYNLAYSAMIIYEDGDTN